MPYIIKTKTYSRGCPLPIGHTRTAVATLDEARHGGADVVEAALGDRVIAAQRMLDVHDPTPEISETYDRLLHACHTLTESGGTIGPLPDGTVIEVRQRSWPDLQADAGLGHRMPLSDANILSYFNTGHYVGAA